jgi:Fe2+ or Zn2+ uptake regulation protein
MLLMQDRGETAVLPAVTAVLLFHRALDIWTDSNVVNTGKSENRGSVCSFCNTLSSQFYGYMD